MHRIRHLRFLPLGLAALAAPLLLGGCISVTRESPPPASTVVIPQGSTAVCSNGTQPPC